VQFAVTIYTSAKLWMRPNVKPHAGNGNLGAYRRLLAGFRLIYADFSAAIDLGKMAGRIADIAMIAPPKLGS